MERAFTVKPYAGLRPYSEEDAPFFFGRDKAREHIITNLKAKRLTLIFGASGVGKSSVLRAGVAYKLRRLAQKNLDEKGEPEFAVVVFKDWAGDPVAGLTTCVQQAVCQALGEPALEPMAQSDSLADTLRAWAEQLHGDLLIILDQFEDYFRYHEGEDGRNGFADELVRLINRSDLRVNVLISIRDDAVSKIKRFRENRFFSNLIEIEHLDRESATAAIKEPIDQYNRFYAASNQRITPEPGLVEEVLRQLWELRTKRRSSGDGGDRVLTKKTDTTAPTMRIEAPVLQLVMTRLWEEEIRSGSTTLRLATLNRLGDAKMSGAEKIFEMHVTQVMEKLSESEQAIAARIFGYMVTSSGDKSARSASDLAELAERDKQELVQLLEKLAHGDSRVLSVLAPRGAESESRYEIFHDVLGPVILEWRRAHTQKLNKRQAEEEKQRATEQARAEEKARARRVLYSVIAVLLMLLLGIVLIAAFRARQQAQATKRYSLRASRASKQTLDTLYQIMIAGGATGTAGENAQLIFLTFNEELESYRRDGNKAGEGVALNNMAGILRLFGESYTRSGNYQQAQKYYQQAQEYYQQARTLLESVLESDHSEVATSLNDLAAVYTAQGRDTEAEPLLKKSLAILEKFLEPDSRSLADAIMNLARCYNNQGKYNEAEPLYNRALEIRKSKLSANSPEWAESLSDLAWFYYGQGKYAEAERRFKQAREIQEANPAAQGNLPVSLSGLGWIYYKQGKYNEAEKYLKSAKENRKDLFDDNHCPLDFPTIAGDSESLGLLYTDQGKYAEAEPYLTEALGFWSQSLGENHPTTAYGLSNLASFYYKRGKHAEAERRFEEAKADFKKAEDGFNKALQIQQAALPQSPELARTLNGLARLYTDSGKYADAEALFPKALAIQEKAIPGHPDLAETLNNYAALLQKTNREVEATQMQERANQIMDTHQRENPDN
jgi:tetratricopeptide (TPR) repeat protein